VIYRDTPIHVAGWAKRFLFRAEQLETAVGRLSGGEQARVLIAQLMLQPADLLLLDEPTNDLDISTLEVLEDSLLDFPGALVLVTHDRYLLDRVVTGVLGLDGEGGAEMFADYSQLELAQLSRKKPKPAAKAPETSAAAASKKRLSYLDTREWASMEERILLAEQALEQKKAEVQEASADGARLQVCYPEMLAAQEEVDRLYARWAELEAKSK
jgi:ATPase components of ABC transporters with duplicated ATPase domains